MLRTEGQRAAAKTAMGPASGAGSPIVSPGKPSGLPVPRGPFRAYREKQDEKRKRGAVEW